MSGNDVIRAAQQMGEAFDRMVAPEALRISKLLVDQLAKELGESPEAWRGAVACISLVGMVATHDDAVERTELESARAALNAIVLLCGTIPAHPAAIAQMKDQYGEDG